MDKDTIVKIIEYGCFAPSGDNSQPWRFVVSENSISIYNYPEKDNPIMNFRQSGSHIAHGGVIENISITCRSFGYKADISLFPEKNNENFIAKITLVSGVKEIDPLFDSIARRCTNRKPYKDTSLTENQKKELASTKKDFNGQILFLEESKKKKVLAKTLSLMEIIALETPPLHKLFFKDIVWSEKEEKEKKSGLYLKTLELPVPARVAFRVIKHWKIMNILNKIGFSKLAGTANAQIYRKSGAFILITLPSHTKENFVSIGRISQRIWLTATKLGLSMQPVTGLVFLGEKIAGGDTSGLNREHLSLIREGHSRIKNLFNTLDHTAFLYRIGEAKSPSARSSRKIAEISFEN